MFENLINFENKAKFYASLGLLFLFLGALYPYFIIWVFDTSSSKYIQTEFELTTYRDKLSNESLTTISKIQNDRIAIPLGFFAHAKLITYALLIGGGVMYSLGLYTWTKKHKTS